MTLIVTGMIGEYAFIAADRKKPPVYDLKKTKTESRILSVNNVFLVGSCNINIAKKYNKYFSKIAKNNPDDLTDKALHLKYFEAMSDCERVNYFLLFRTTSNQIYHTLYSQTGETSHEVHTLNMRKDRNDVFCLIPPFDLDGEAVQDRLNYLVSIMPDKSLSSITNVLKQLYTECSHISPFVMSGFHFAVLHQTEPDVFKFIDN